MGLLDTAIKMFVGDKNKKDLKAINPIVEQIKSAEKQLEQLSLDELRSKTTEFKNKIKSATQSVQSEIDKEMEKADQSEDIAQKEAIYAHIDELKDKRYKLSEDTLNEILPEAFAVVKETAKRFYHNDNLEVTANEKDRTFSAQKHYIKLEGDKAIWHNQWDAAGKAVTWDMIHYDVQLIGGIAMHQGKIAEMQTGEGKTLVATLPLYLNALTEKGAHLVTVNDYLAKRDSLWMAPLFEFHGMRVDCVDYYQPNSEDRRNAYKADITYGTNNEFGFDYLRDNMSHSPEDLVQHEHNFSIVDEVDSVLIDDARTPLIISGPVPKGDDHEFNELKPKVAQIVDAQRKKLTKVLAEAKQLIREGNTKEGGFKLLQVQRGLPKNKALIRFLSEEGIKQLLQKTENFYMQDNNREMHKVDNELYFVIEEKSNQIDLTDQGVEFLSDEKEDDFFVMPEIGMEIAKIEDQNLPKEEEIQKKEEAYKDFSIKSERIHTMRQLLKAYTLFEKDTEYVVIDNKVKIVDEQTGRIMEGRRYSDGLHQAIEAKENVKIEDATQTFATITLQNYFRMYRKLAGMTGTAVTEAGEFWEIYELDVMEIPTNKPVIREDKQDMVFKTKREKYNAIIDEVVQLSQAGRPVLIGTTSVDISELLSRMLEMKKIKHNVLNAKRHKKEAEIVAEAGNAGVVTIATNMAGRGTDIKLSDEVKKAGGLAIVGTERHDSRRVDRQLRGRSGRQGDPGSSQFYVSLEDNLMRVFGSERIAKLMDRMGLEEGEVIQHSMISNSIERAQKKVEENNFGTRKNLLEYDDVMNAQREVIYKRRYHALFGERLRIDIANMIYDTAEVVTQTNKQANDYSNFELEVIRFFSMNPPISQEEFEKMNEQKIIEKLNDEAYKHYQDKINRSAEEAFPVIKNVYETQGEKYERIAVPFTDGQKTLQVVTNLKKAYESEGEQLIKDFEKNITLAIIDEALKNHLRKMDELKQSVQLAVHEQKDPLLIYKFEAFELFSATLEEVNKDVISFLYIGEIPQQEESKIREARSGKKQENYNTRKDEVQNLDQQAAQNRQAGQNTGGQQKLTETIVRDKPKIGRNERVVIQNVKTGEEKTLKYKQAIPMIEKGEWVLRQEDQLS
jgi:preprotein translocase subunit SecA